MLNNPISSDLIRGHIDTIVLHSLTKSDMHAQQISDFIEEKSNNQYKINQATLYSSLKRLENLKFVSSYYNDSDSGRRKFFHILEKGVSYVDENLSLWSESKNILDKLMDIPTEKVVYVTHNNTQNSQVNTDNSSINKNVNKTDGVSTSFIGDETTKNNNIDNSNINTNTNNVKTITENDEKEINFRAILNSLIKTTENSNNSKKDEDDGPEPLNIVISEPESPVSKLKFNDTISETDYNAKKTNNDGKIDFGDLTIKAEKDGYKIRISSKEVSKPSGFVYVNKLNCYTSILIFLLTIFEYTLFRIFSPQVFNTALKIISLLVICVVPAVRLGVYFTNKCKKTYKKNFADSILICAIVVFNLILINLAFLFILDVDLSESFNIISYFIMPLCIYIDSLIYFVVKNYLSKSKKFITK